MHRRTRVALFIAAVILPLQAFAAPPCGQTIPALDQEFQKNAMFLRDPGGAGRQLDIAKDLCRQGREGEANQYLDLVRSQLQLPTAAAATTAVPACAQMIPQLRQAFDEQQVRMLPNDRQTVDWNLHLADTSCRQRDEKTSAAYLKTVRSQLQMPDR